MRGRAFFEYENNRFNPFQHTADVQPPRSKHYDLELWKNRSDLSVGTVLCPCTCYFLNEMSLYIKRGPYIFYMPVTESD